MKFLIKNTAGCVAWKVLENVLRICKVKHDGSAIAGDDVMQPPAYL